MSNGHEKKSSVNWGGIVAGAAVVAGVMLVAPDFIPGLVKTAAETVTSIGQSLASIGSETVKEKVVSEPGMIAKGLDSAGMWVATKAAGIALAIGGAIHLMSDKKEAPEPEHRLHRQQNEEGFRAQLDMEKMQKLMALRYEAVTGQSASAGQARG